MEKPKKKKKGDTFVENGYLYRVIEVCADGTCISKRIGRATEGE